MQSAHEVLLGHRVLLGSLEIWVRPVRWDLLGRKVLLETMEPLVLRVSRVVLVTEVLLELPALKVHEERRENGVPVAHQDRLTMLMANL